MAVIIPRKIYFDNISRSFSMKEKGEFIEEKTFRTKSILKMLGVIFPLTFIFSFINEGNNFILNFIFLMLLVGTFLLILLTVVFGGSEISNSTFGSTFKYNKFCSYITMISENKQVYEILSNYKKTDQKEHFIIPILNEHGLKTSNDYLALVLSAFTYIEKESVIVKNLGEELSSLEMVKYKEDLKETLDNVVYSYCERLINLTDVFMMEFVEILNFISPNIIKYSSMVKKIERFNNNIAYNKYKESIISGNLEGYASIGKIDSMDGYEFEIFLGELFKKMGFTVKNTSLSGDQGADLIIEKFGERSVVQAKCYSGTVGNKAVQEIVGSKKIYDAQRGYVVTNNYFTKSAIEMSLANDIELIDRDKLIDLIKTY